MEFTRRQVVKGAGKIALMVGTAGLFAACQSSGSTSLVKRAYTYNQEPTKDDPVTGRGISTYRGSVLKDYYATQGTIFDQHRGIDWGGPTGEPIIAIANGVVVAVNRTSHGSDFISLEHRRAVGGFSSQYLHISDHNHALKVGDPVKRGDVIAFVGESGTRFPHLHLNFFDSWGAKIDPMLHGVFYPGFIPSIPLFDYKADLDVPIDQRENYLAQYQEKDELDRRLGNYDGPERRALQSARGNVARMKELLLNATAKTKKHTPGSPIYTVALEVFTFSADEDRLAVTHPLKEM